MIQSPLYARYYERYDPALLAIPALASTPLTITLPLKTKFIILDGRAGADILIEVGETLSNTPRPTVSSRRVLTNTPTIIQVNEEDQVIIKLCGNTGTATAALTLCK